MFSPAIRRRSMNAVEDIVAVGSPLVHLLAAHLDGHVARHGLDLPVDVQLHHVVHVLLLLLLLLLLVLVVLLLLLLLVVVKLRLPWSPPPKTPLSGSRSRQRRPQRLAARGSPVRAAPPLSSQSFQATRCAESPRSQTRPHPPARSCGAVRTRPAAARGACISVAEVRGGVALGVAVPARPRRKLGGERAMRRRLSRGSTARTRRGGGVGRVAAWPIRSPEKFQSHNRSPLFSYPPDLWPPTTRVRRRPSLSTRRTLLREGQRGGQ
mmetsp:Transcript_46534/g.110858  ORF Transcript_46534/g.110858 Transcript_46534/m.110858 type:complete len:266 (+) Transcript_46534:267-1064(+)